MSTADLATPLCTYAAEKLAQNLGQLGRCARLLTTEELWQRSNAHTNSVGNLLLHLTGNVRQWIIAGLGGAACDRDRPAEFAARDALPVSEVLGPLERTVGHAARVIADMTAVDLARTYSIQGYAVSGVEAVFHVVEHFSFHTGQVVHITKLLRNVDLSLYDEQGQKLAGDPRQP